MLFTSRLVSSNLYGRLDPLPWIPSLDLITLLPKLLLDKTLEEILLHVFRIFRMRLLGSQLDLS